ncbi:MAG: PAS domain-containing protein [Desulfobacteraceae bacterium]|nr:PAS domain-containing protein [Desulfobacteraceae bacterium]MBC2754005.1 PAS domain-containing protein [Desulfobacteraceae bacterium]
MDKDNKFFVPGNTVITVFQDVREGDSILLTQNSLTNNNFYRIVFDAIPSPAYVVKKDVQVVDCNTAASKMLSKDPELIIRTRLGEVIQCLHSTEGCGNDPFCEKCIIRHSVNQSLSSQKVIRQKAKISRRTR